MVIQMRRFSLGTGRAQKHQLWIVDVTLTSLNSEPPRANLSGNNRIANIWQREDIIDQNIQKEKPGVRN